MTTKLVDDYVNFIIDSMSQKLKEETLYDYLVSEYKNVSDEQLANEIRENYGDEWFEEHN
jgi:predicted house-cleaning noncanonical NTP pyrophosphatase (MazG superfamily)